MRNKHLIVLIVLGAALVAVGFVQAQITVSAGITVKSGVVTLGNQAIVPVGTVVDLYCFYHETGGHDGIGTLYYRYDATDWPSGPYSSLQTYDPITSGSTEVYTGFTLSQVGYYDFRFEAEMKGDPGNGAYAHSGVQTTDSPPVPEPATIAGIGVAIVAIGAVLLLKKPSKPSVTA